MRPTSSGSAISNSARSNVKLSTRVRKALPKMAFGEPEQRKYPTQMVAKGKLSADEAAKIRAKANRILGEK